jgi:hypothetical protein
LGEEKTEVKKEESKEIQAPEVTVYDETTITVGAEFFSKCFEQMSAFGQSEVIMEIRDDCLYQRQMDDARVSQVDFQISKVNFRELKKGKEINSLRFASGDMVGVLKKIAKGDMITFTIGKFGGLDCTIKGRRIDKYHIPLFEVGEGESRTPKLTLPFKAKLDVAGTLQAVTKAGELFNTKKKKENWSGAMTLLSNTGGVLLIFGEKNLRAGESQLLKGWDVLEFEGKTGIEIVVGQSYLQDVLTAMAKLTNVVQVEFGKVMPVKLIVQLPFKGSLIYWLAPRIELEDESSGGEAK